MNEIEITFDNYIAFDSYEEMTQHFAQDVGRRVREIWNTIGTEPTGKVEMKQTSYDPMQEIEPIYLGKSIGKYQMVHIEDKFLLNYKPPLDH